VLELIDPEPETVVLEPDIAAPWFEAVGRYSYKDSDTQGVASSHTCWR